jgi:hypothetical protein
VRIVKKNYPNLKSNIKMTGLIIHHAKGVSEAEIAAFKEQIPEQYRGITISVKEYPEMPKGLITATPTLMKQRGIDLINKRR